MIEIDSLSKLVKRCQISFLWTFKLWHLVCLSVHQIVIPFNLFQILQMQQMVGRRNNESQWHIANKWPRIATNNPFLRCYLSESFVVWTFVQAKSFEKLHRRERNCVLGSESNQSKWTSHYFIHWRLVGNIKSPTSFATNKRIWLWLREMFGCDRIWDIFQWHEMYEMPWRIVGSEQLSWMESRLEVKCSWYRF